MNALDGIRVLDLSRVLAGPWSTQILADLGADVVKVERLGTGDDTRGWGPPFLHDAQGNDTAEAAYYLGTNRNKRSLTLNLKKPGALDILMRLVAQADVLVENWRPDVKHKLGLGYEDLAKVNPRISGTGAMVFARKGIHGIRATASNSRPPTPRLKCPKAQDSKMENPMDGRRSP